MRKRSRKSRQTAPTIDPSILAWEQAVYEQDPTGGQPSNY